ncbi:immunity repressor [Mycobacterium phage SuperAwesome]|uniref:Immunity repressor n=6 Tax=Caudoviricetes TaxID=2731619 RepID=A0A6G8R1F8_9CAUD|nr:immunity repressor [Mycobacterium phage SuperAwesome]QIN93798.1 immunity repressor [Mycobacterium phage Pmask]
MEGNMSGNTRAPLIFSVIEDLRKKGYNQSEIAEMHGVTRQAVSWQKKTYGGHLTPRQIVNEAWPWQTTNLHGKSKPFQRLRDHGEFMATGGRGMNETKLKLLRSFWTKLRDEDVVVEFDPNIEPYPGMAGGGFRYVPRTLADDDLLIRANEYTTLTANGKRIWVWPPDKVFDHQR